MIIIIALKGAVQDFLQSSHCAANWVQHIHSIGKGAIVSKSHATHRALIACYMSCANHYTTRQLESIWSLVHMHMYLFVFSVTAISPVRIGKRGKGGGKGGGGGGGEGEKLLIISDSFELQMMARSKAVMWMVCYCLFVTAYLSSSYCFVRFVVFIHVQTSLPTIDDYW